MQRTFRKLQRPLGPKNSVPVLKKRKPIVLHSLIRLQNPYHPSSVVCSAEDQPLCARTSTVHWTCTPIEICNSDTREDAKNHSTVSCNCLQGDPCTVFEPFSRWTASGRRSFRRTFPIVVRLRFWSTRGRARNFSLYTHRGGNCMRLLSCTSPLLSSNSNLLLVSEHLQVLSVTMVVEWGSRRVWWAAWHNGVFNVSCVEVCAHRSFWDLCHCHFGLKSLSQLMTHRTGHVLVLTPFLSRPRFDGLVWSWRRARPSLRNMVQCDWRPYLLQWWSASHQLLQWSQHLCRWRSTSLELLQWSQHLRQERRTSHELLHGSQYLRQWWSTSRQCLLSLWCQHLPCAQHQRLWRSAPHLPCSWRQLEPCAQRQRQWRSSAESQRRCEQRRRCGVTSSTAVASSSDLQSKWQGTSRNACRVRGLFHACAQRLRQWESAVCTVRWAVLLSASKWAVWERVQARHARCLLLAVQTASKWAVCVPSVGRVVVCESQIWLDISE